MHTVAIIPARGGSKRIPDKNTKPFAGKPIIAYSILAARQSAVFDRIIVSTDSEQIGAVAREFGAETPFLRPRDLSDDHTPTAPVLLHALKFLIAREYPVDYFACIYATAPLIRAADIRRGFELLREKNGLSALSVTTFTFPIFRALKLTENGRVNFFWPEHRVTRSQDLPQAYHDAGMFYVFEAARFLELENCYAPGQMPIILPDAIPVMLPRSVVQDIDTPEDWETAEYMYRALNLRNKS